MPAFVVEHHFQPGQELLQRPAPHNPSTLPSFLIANADVGQVSIAELCVLVPVIYRIDRFRQFRAASLINPAGIYPDILMPRKHY